MFFLLNSSAQIVLLSPEYISGAVLFSLLTVIKSIHLSTGDSSPQCKQLKDK